MESKVVGYCTIAAVLGIISSAAGFAGEVTRVTDSEVYFYNGYCYYPRRTAFALGIVSVVFTIVTRIYMSVSFGAFCCCQRDPNSTPISRLLVVLSWVASVVAVVVLAEAANFSAQRESIYPACLVVKPGIFATGATLALLSAIFGVAAYIISTPSPPTNASAISMGDPEKSPTPFAQNYGKQQYPPHQNATQNYNPQQNATQNYHPHQNATQNYPPQQYPTNQNPTQNHPPHQNPTQN